VSPPILIVEDDAQMRRYLSTTMASHGFDTAEASTIAEAEHALRSTEPQLVLLDLGLPDGDGLDLLRTMRLTTRIPVIILSARGREAEKVAALDAGADDYLTKPFGVAELLARVRVALRHAGSGGPPSEVLTSGPIRIDRSRHEVAIDGTAVHLTPIEFQLLAILVQNAGRVLTHRQLLRAVWGPDAIEQTQYLRVHMAALRRKVERDPARPRWLVTEAGVGYRLRDDAT
jgi:two-component system, OmpR family, KDP operon response regulator KdpE